MTDTFTNHSSAALRFLIDEETRKFMQALDDNASVKELEDILLRLKTMKNALAKKEQDENKRK